MAGYPAGLVLDSVINDDSDAVELRVAFDLDGVLADDSAEQVFRTGGIEAFQRSESDRLAYRTTWARCRSSSSRSRSSRSSRRPGGVRARL